MRTEVDEVLNRLQWMRGEGIWPNGLRYLWTDAFGVVLLISLRNMLADDRYLDEAKWVIREVDRVLGRPVGLRIGQQPDRDGQYYHYLAMWLFALSRVGKIEPQYRDQALALARGIHPRFVVPGVGVVWKMREDLSGPYPGYGWGALDAFHGLTVYRQLDAVELAPEIQQLEALVDRSYPTLHATQDLGLGMLLWMSHFYPRDHWASCLRERSLQTLDRMWVNSPGYFCRESLGDRRIKFAFTNYGVSLGLQAARMWPDRVARVNEFFAHYRSGDSYDRDAITHVMGCCSVFPGEWL